MAAGQSSLDMVDVSDVDSTSLVLSDDLFDVKSELTPVSANWKSIGIALRLNPDTLDSIQANNNNDSTACLTSMVTEWLKRNYNAKKFGEPTWRWLVKAVGDPAGGANVALARDISRRHKAGVPRNPVPTKKSPPTSLQEVEESQITAHQESSSAAFFKHENQATIKAKFADFQTKVCERLVKNGANIELVRLFVKNQFPPGDCIPPPPAGLIEIFGAITHHGLWDYLHYSPLVKIAQRFGAQDLELESYVETYKKDIKSFRLVTKVEDVIGADLDFADLPPAKKAKYTTHVDEAHFPPEERAKNNLHYYCPVEWKTEFIDHSLQYLAEVWEEFSCHYLGPKSPPTALLNHVRKGCFSVTWLVPSYLIPALSKGAKTDTDFFQQHHIVRVTVGEECVYEELTKESATIADVPSLDDQDKKLESESEVPSEKELVGENEQLMIKTGDHSAAFKDLPLLTYTGPLATVEYHDLEKQFTELYLSTDHEQIRQLSKQRTSESSISPDIKVFALCWEALSESACENYECAEKLLRTAWKEATVLECKNSLLLQGRVLKHLAHLQYDLGNDDKALEYVLQAKERMYNAAPSNETAFTLYTELLVKTRKLFRAPFSVELYKSIESEYELLLDHAKHMEEYEQPVICNFFAMKAAFHLRSDLITNKLPPKEYQPSPDDLRKAEECLSSVPLDIMPSLSNSYTARYYRTLCDLHIWKREYSKAMDYLKRAVKLEPKMHQLLGLRTKLLEILKSNIIRLMLHV